MSEALKKNQPGSFSKLIEEEKYNLIELKKIIESLGGMTDGNVEMIRRYLKPNGIEENTDDKRKRRKRRSRRSNSG